MAELATVEEYHPCSFSDFPEDVQLCILSFLTPPEISSFACTSKRSLSLCRNDAKLWFSLCHRKWGLKTQIHRWGHGRVTYRHLYKTLTEFETLIGFWRRSGGIAPRSQPPLVLFEWGPSFVAGFRVLPSDSGSCRVVKAPFLWLSIMPDGSPVSFLDPDCRLELSNGLTESGELRSMESELVPASVSFMGNRHVVVEENLSPSYSDSVGGNLNGSKFGDNNGSDGSLMMSEIYQYLANRTSPGGDRASRRRQRKREKERRKVEPEHFVKIVNCSPTPTRPLQGLWEGVGDDMKMELFLVVYDDIGGIVCRRVGEWSQPFSGYSPVFWTSNTFYIEPPFSTSEQYLYESRVHLRPSIASDFKSYIHNNDVVTRILHINSSYDLVIPDLAEVSTNPCHVEGRIWQYGDGTFGFGFLRNNYIIDLKPIARDASALDTTEHCSD